MHEDETTFKELAESCRETQAVQAHDLFNNEIMSDAARIRIWEGNPCMICGLPYSKCPARRGR